MVVPTLENLIEKNKNYTKIQEVKIGLFKDIQSMYGI